MSSDDIVERLRQVHQTVPIPSIASLYSNAADEIERLRGEPKFTTDEMEAIRRQLFRMAHDLMHGCTDKVNHGQAHRGIRWWLVDELPDSVINWALGEEARRG